MSGIVAKTDPSLGNQVLLENWLTALILILFDMSAYQASSVLFRPTGNGRDFNGFFLFFFFFCSFVLLFFCSFVLLFFCSFVLQPRDRPWRGTNGTLYKSLVSASSRQNSLLPVNDGPSFI